MSINKKNQLKILILDKSIKNIGKLKSKPKKPVRNK